MKTDTFDLYQKSDHVINALLDISALVNENYPANVLYQKIHQTINDVIDVNNIAIALYDEETQTVTFDYIVDEKDGALFAGQTVPLGPGLTSFLIRSKRPQILDKNGILRLQNSGEIDSALGTISESWLGVPFVKGEKVYGVLIVQSYTQTTMYSEQHLKFLSFVSAHITNVIIQKQFSLEQHNIKTTLRKNLQVIKKQNKQLENMMSELKQTQEALVQKEKMASLGNLVAGVAHEINTPLGICVTGITNMGYIYKTVNATFKSGQLTAEELRDFFEDFEDHCNIIEANCRRAADLVNSFKKLAVDQNSPEIRPIKLKTYIEEVIHSLKPLLKPLTHAVEVSGDTQLTIHSTPGVISQVITNLIQNSLVHGFDNMEQGIIHINIRQTQNAAIVTYRDNGHGMSKEQLAHLFEPFYTTKRNQGGSGLGAHLVYNLVTTTLQGHIAAQSEANDGLQYTITLPITLDNPPTSPDD